MTMKRNFDTSLTLKFFDTKGRLQKVLLTDEFGLKVIIVGPWDVQEAMQTAERLAPTEHAIKTGWADIYKMTG